MSRVIAIVGPTASGKTSLSLLLAEKFNGEIVSADSRQIYRGMDIGTAKASPAELKAIPHNLVDIRNPDEDYTVADFKGDAVRAIDDILTRKKLPILAGGTGLYIKSVVENLDIPEIKADPKLRKEIENEIENQGLDAVFKKLVELDPEAAYVVDPKNPRRVIRALEVAMITGRPFTEQRKMQAPLYEFLMIGVNLPPDVLRDRIDRRIDLMMHDGLEGEVQKLVKKYGEQQVAFDAIGYREIIDCLNGKSSLDEATAAMKLNTWHFAKRQMTWFKKDKNINWVKNSDEAEDLAEKYLT